MAIVGPNGCGKSNIVDAIRWVLGEQRTRSLRADKMEAVIFNGTQKRKPLGMAEVTINIENDNGLLSSSCSEIAITRRLFRSGDSEYLINKTPSRLRDIHDLFMDTGLTHNTYSIIELQMVESIISGPSESRRRLIEEAAGIAKYKSRKNSAEKRLSSTKENLIRLNDIHGEIEKQFKSLRRQASKALRHRALQKALELYLLIDLCTENIGLREKQIPVEKELKGIRDSLDRTEETLNANRTQLNAFEGKELLNKSNLNRIEDSLKNLEQKAIVSDRETALSSQRRDYLSIKIDELNEQKHELTKQSERNVEDFNNLQEEIKDLEKESGLTKSSLETKIKELEKYNETYTNGREKLIQARERVDSLKMRFKSQNDEINKNKDEQIKINSRIIKLREKSQSISEEKKRKRNNIEELSETNKYLKKQFDITALSLKDNRAKLVTFRGQQNSHMSKTINTKVELDTTKAMLKAHLAQSNPKESKPEVLREISKTESLLTVEKLIETPSKYQAAIGAVLERILTAYEIPDIRTLLMVSENLKPTENAILRVINSEQESLGQIQLSDHTEDSVIASDVIRNKGEFGRFLTNRLSRTVIVPGLDQMLNLIDWAKQEKVCLVTLGGEVFEADGVFYLGESKPELLQIGWATRKESYEKEILTKEVSFSKIEKEMISINQEIALTETQISEKRKLSFSLQDKIETNKRVINHAREDLRQIEKNDSNLLSELNNLKQHFENNAEKEKQFKKETGLSKELSNLENKYSILEQDFKTAEHSRFRLIEERATITSRLTQINEKLSNHKQLSKSLDHRQLTFKKDMATLNSKFAHNTQEIKDAKLNIQKLLSQTKNINKAKLEIIDSLTKTKAKLSDIKQNQQSLRALRENSIKEQQSLLELRSEVEAQAISLRQRVKEIDKRIELESQFTSAGINQNTIDDAQEELENLKLGELSTEEIRIRISSLGPVNMLAINEIGEVRDRYNFLSDQKKDLENAIELLEDTIDRINIEARRRFRETFDHVNKNFQNLFRELFEGGESRIILDDADPLEADISILATPTGKKLQTLSMLSGGEKSLTSIAFLFAIYQVRPSPFCILDEIDAPLDDANVIRFNKLINRFSENTQYLIISHNKKTMSVADCLIGVTLAEDGASKLVSVKIEKEDDRDE